MNVTFELSDLVRNELNESEPEIARQAKEAFLVELYRTGRITRYQLATALGLDDYDTDGVLKKHEVPTGPTLEQRRQSAEALRKERVQGEVRPR